MVIDLRQSFDHIAALLREARDQIYKIAPGMSKAVGQDRLQLLGHIAAQGITHMNGRAKTQCPLFEDLSHILASMLVASKEKGHAALVSHGKDPRGETPFSGCLIIPFGLF